MKKYKFSPSLMMLCLTAVVVTILVGLGYWQVCRAREKSRMLADYAAMQRMPPRNILSFHHAEPVLAYQPLMAVGRYDNEHQIFLDNQYYQHQFGYHVITPLVLPNDKIVLIDRGWIIGKLDRNTLPTIAAVDSVQTVVGTADYAAAQSWVLGKGVVDGTKQWPLRVERIDPAQLAKLLGKDIYLFAIRLNKDQDNGFIRDWKLVIMMPSRHIAYAVQWFLMALVVIIIFISLNLERNHDG